MRLNEEIGQEGSKETNLQLQENSRLEMGEDKDNQKRVMKTGIQLKV